MNRLPNPMNHINIHGLDQKDLIYHVEVNEFPEGADYLQGAALSEDESRPGWVTMPVLEAEGGEIVDHAVGVKDLHFRVPDGYNIGADGVVLIRLAFVSDNNSHAQSEWANFIESIGD